MSGFVGETVLEGRVLPEWIDVNSHMNVAYYILIFDLGIDTVWEQIGMTDERRLETHSSTFAVDCHATWQREIAVDEPYVVTTQILGYDDKRIHQFMRLYHADEQYLAATGEWLNLHVDLSIRRVTPWPDEVLDRIADFASKQRDVDWPGEAGKQITIAKPLYDLRTAAT